jgi:hypothetical protein
LRHAGRAKAARADEVGERLGRAVLGDQLLGVEIDGRSPDASGLSGILCAGPGFPSGSDEAFAEHDGELGLGLGPFARRHFPFPDDLAQDEKDELRRRLIARKMASRSHRSP